MNKLKFLLFTSCILVATGKSQNIRNNPSSNHGNRFEQLGTILPDANSYRTASGAPGHQYWQMRADYDIDARLDENKLHLFGSEWVTYYNNSPDVLHYIWLQLDENEHHPQSSNNYAAFESKTGKQITERNLTELDRRAKLEGFGVQIESVTDAKNKALVYFINETMMRIELPAALKPGSSFKFFIRWNYKIPDRLDIGGRGGYELFPEDGNHLFTMAQWFPRLCVYSDFQGWQHKQFTGRAEFALPFGNYKVRITVPDDHVVAATGVCQNYKKVLTTAQYNRWQKAQNAKEPIEIVTLEEAKSSELKKSANTKTWIYHAENVRDFAWGSSRKFIWDAVPTFIEGRKVLCMSYYAKEAYGLYRKYSSKTVAHTLQTYSKFSIPYPYPVAISVEASNGMEYPMICFNFGRTEKDGTYSEGSKNGMLGVIIHEVGHNFFPMIVNSDERQWTWMDEGINTFVQTLTQEEFDLNYPAGRGAAANIVSYMKLSKDQLEPIMTNSENLVQFGSNAYAKTAAGLNILRETIIGRERFDKAFKEYSRRWAFKHPTPADFFRSMEDASGEDLDWFWRAWFYDIEPVDIAIDSVRIMLTNHPAPPRKETYYWQQPGANENITKYRNRTSGMSFLVDRDTSLRDFYYYYDSPKAARKISFNLNPAPAALQKGGDSTYLYEVHFSNKGGMVMPLIIRWNYEDSTFEDEKLSVQIWRKNEEKVIKTFIRTKKVQSIQLDPFLETADINTENNNWNMSEEPSRFELFKSEARRSRRRSGPIDIPNPMQQEQKKKTQN
ncbi:MAG: M1 family metallopeptidase [Saprospiraceae bacterium]|nr:M1 family metallopeptidase [Saprospiraceae bacterium]